MENSTEGPQPAEQSRTTPGVSGYLKAIFLNAFSVLLWRLIAGGLLAYASIDKIMSPGLFAAVIRQYQIMPTALLGLFADLVPKIELLAGGLFVFGLFMRPAAAVCGGLYAVFLFGLVQALLRHLNIRDCGCGISPGEPISWALVARDVILLAMCALAFFAPTDRLTLDRFFARKSEE